MSEFPDPNDLVDPDRSVDSIKPGLFETAVETSGQTGPVILGHDTAREQFEEYACVATFRDQDRTVGRTWWTTERTGSKCGNCAIALLTDDVRHSDRTVLQTWRPWSGFETVGDWQEAIRDLHGADTTGAIYMVVAPEHYVYPEGES